MINTGSESDFGGFEGVVSGEMDVQEEDSALVRGVRGAHDGGLPVEQVTVIHRAGGAVGRGVLVEVHQFFLYPLKCHLFNYLIHLTIYYRE